MHNNSLLVLSWKNSTHNSFKLSKLERLLTHTDLLASAHAWMYGVGLKTFGKLHPLIHPSSQNLCGGWAWKRTLPPHWLPSAHLKPWRCVQPPLQRQHIRVKEQQNHSRDTAESSRSVPRPGAGIFIFLINLFFAFPGKDMLQACWRVFFETEFCSIQ